MIAKSHDPEQSKSAFLKKTLLKKIMPQR